MKSFENLFFRFTALVLLITFTFVSCYNPFQPPNEPPIIITPGEGTPRYVYLDSNLNTTETDTGKTALFIEDNKNARGVTVVADKADDKDRVMIYNKNNNSVISMFFKPGSNFPYYMVINQNNETFYAYLSNYKTSSSTYDIFFSQNDEYHQLYSQVLNSNIFNLYQDDPDLSVDQNLRLRNITIALGLCGSLYNAFEEPVPPPTLNHARLSLKSFVSSIKSVFKSVSLIATVVAVYVAPIVSFINPALGKAVFIIATIVKVASDAIVLGLTELEKYLPNSPPEKVQVPALSVSNFYEKKQITNGVEFHIGRGKDVLLEFCSPGLDNTKITIEQLIGNKQLEDIYLGWEKENTAFPYLANSRRFTITLEITDPTNGTALPSDRFLVRIKRSQQKGYDADGKVAFGFRFENENLHINGEVQPVEYKFLDEQEPSTRTNTVVVNFCIDPDCPDYIDS